MGKSARVLGWEFAKTAREMNELFKQHGYLEGEPGAYGLTEKGKQYAEEKYHTNGVGGYSHYQVNYETRTWNNETAAALQTDIDSFPEDFATDDVLAREDARDDAGFEYDPPSNYEDDGEDFPLGWKVLVVGGVVVGAVLVAPHVMPFYRNRLKPAAKRFRDKITKQQAAMAQKAEDKDESE